ncbi:MAG TPA: glycosyltransferase family 2 protein [Roseateles sp.]
MKLGIVSIQKNRAPWLHEWVAFHHLVGFSTFFVYAHNCTDHSADVLRRLATRYDVRPMAVETNEDRVQLKAYEHALTSFGHECDWFAFIDGDEFLFPVAAPDVQTALREFDYTRTSAIGVHWACFGSAGHVQEPAGLVTENYRRRAPLDFPANHHVKSLVRGRQDSHAGANSHLFSTPWGTQDELGRPLPGAVSPHAPTHAKLRVNHYVTQSLQFFRQVKQTSGAADAGAAMVRPDSWWGNHDRNDEADDSMAVWLPRLKAEMALLDIPGTGVLQPLATA